MICFKVFGVIVPEGTVGTGRSTEGLGGKEACQLCTCLSHSQSPLSGPLSQVQSVESPNKPCLCASLLLLIWS